MIDAESRSLRFDGMRRRLEVESQRLRERGEEWVARLRRSPLLVDLTEKGRELPQRTRQRWEKLGERLEPGLGKLAGRLERGVVAVFHRLGLPHAEDVAALAQRVEELARKVDSLGSEPSATTLAVFQVRPRLESWEVATEAPRSAVETFDNKRLALERGRRLYRGTAPSKLVVFKKDGSVQTTFTNPAA